MVSREACRFHLRRIGPASSRPDNPDIIEFERTITTIGRQPTQSDYVISSRDHVQNSIISRRHARVVRGNNGFHKLFDDSKNGIFVNDTKIEGHIILEEGDTVTFGHRNGEQLLPGTRVRQPDSEYQFMFEACNCEQGRERPHHRCTPDNVNSIRIDRTLSPTPGNHGVQVSATLAGQPPLRIASPLSSPSTGTVSSPIDDQQPVDLSVSSPRPSLLSRTPQTRSTVWTSGTRTPDLHADEKPSPVIGQGFSGGFPVITPFCPTPSPRARRPLVQTVTANQRSYSPADQLSTLVTSGYSLSQVDQGQSAVDINEELPSEANLQTPQKQQEIHFTSTFASSSRRSCNGVTSGPLETSSPICDMTEQDEVEGMSPHINPSPGCDMAVQVDLISKVENAQSVTTADQICETSASDAHDAHSCASELREPENTPNEPLVLGFRGQCEDEARADNQALANGDEKSEQNGTNIGVSGSGAASSCFLSMTSVNNECEGNRNTMEIFEQNKEDVKGVTCETSSQSAQNNIAFLTVTEAIEREGEDNIESFNINSPFDVCPETETNRSCMSSGSKLQGLCIQNTAVTEDDQHVPTIQVTESVITSVVENTLPQKESCCTDNNGQNRMTTHQGIGSHLPQDSVEDNDALAACMEVHEHDNEVQVQHGAKPSGTQSAEPVHVKGPTLNEAQGSHVSQARLLVRKGGEIDPSGDEEDNMEEENCGNMTLKNHKMSQRENLHVPEIEQMGCKEISGDSILDVQSKELTLTASSTEIPEIDMELKMNFTSTPIEQDLCGDTDAVKIVSDPDESPEFEMSVEENSVDTSKCPLLIEDKGSKPDFNSPDEEVCKEPTLTGDLNETLEMEVTSDDGQENLDATQPFKIGGSISNVAREVNDVLQPLESKYSHATANALEQDQDQTADMAESCCIVETKDKYLDVTPPYDEESGPNEFYLEDTSEQDPNKTLDDIDYDFNEKDDQKSEDCEKDKTQHFEIGSVDVDLEETKEKHLDQTQEFGVDEECSVHGKDNFCVTVNMSNSGLPAAEVSKDWQNDPKQCCSNSANAVGEIITEHKCGDDAQEEQDLIAGKMSQVNRGSEGDLQVEEFTCESGNVDVQLMEDCIGCEDLGDNLQAEQSFQSGSQNVLNEIDAKRCSLDEDISVPAGEVVDKNSLEVVHCSDPIADPITIEKSAGICRNNVKEGISTLGDEYMATFSAGSGDLGETSIEKSGEEELAVDEFTTTVVENSAVTEHDWSREVQPSDSVEYDISDSDGNDDEEPMEDKHNIQEFVTGEINDFVQSIDLCPKNSGSVNVDIKEIRDDTHLDCNVLQVEETIVNEGSDIQTEESIHHENCGILSRELLHHHPKMDTFDPKEMEDTAVHSRADPKCQTVQSPISYETITKIETIPKVLTMKTSEMSINADAHSVENDRGSFLGSTTGQPVLDVPLISENEFNPSFRDSCFVEHLQKPVVQGSLLKVPKLAVEQLLHAEESSVQSFVREDQEQTVNHCFSVEDHKIIDGADKVKETNEVTDDESSTYEQDGIFGSPKFEVFTDSQAVLDEEKVQVIADDSPQYEKEGNVVHQHNINEEPEASVVQSCIGQEGMAEMQSPLHETQEMAVDQSTSQSPMQEMQETECVTTGLLGKQGDDSSEEEMSLTDQCTTEEFDSNAGQFTCDKAEANLNVDIPLISEESDSTFKVSSCPKDKLKPQAETNEEPEATVVQSCIGQEGMAEMQSPLHETQEMAVDQSTSRSCMQKMQETECDTTGLLGKQGDDSSEEEMSLTDQCTTEEFDSNAGQFTCDKAEANLNVDIPSISEESESTVEVSSCPKDNLKPQAETDEEPEATVVQSCIGQEGMAEMQSPLHATQEMAVDQSTGQSPMQKMQETECDMTGSLGKQGDDSSEEEMSPTDQCTTEEFDSNDGQFTFDKAQVNVNVDIPSISEESDSTVEVFSCPKDEGITIDELIVQKEISPVDHYTSEKIASSAGQSTIKETPPDLIVDVSLISKESDPKVEESSLHYLQEVKPALLKVPELSVELSSSHAEGLSEVSGVCGQQGTAVGLSTLQEQKMSVGNTKQEVISGLPPMDEQGFTIQSPKFQEHIFSPDQPTLSEKEDVEDSPQSEKEHSEVYQSISHEEDLIVVPSHVCMKQEGLSGSVALLHEKQEMPIDQPSLHEHATVQVGPSDLCSKEQSASVMTDLHEKQGLTIDEVPVQEEVLSVGQCIFAGFENNSIEPEMNEELLSMVTDSVVSGKLFENADNSVAQEEQMVPMLDGQEEIPVTEEQNLSEYSSKHGISQHKFSTSEPQDETGTEDSDGTVSACEGFEQEERNLNTSVLKKQEDPAVESISEEHATSDNEVNHKAISKFHDNEEPIIYTDTCDTLEQNPVTCDKETLVISELSCVLDHNKSVEPKSRVHIGLTRSSISEPSIPKEPCEAFCHPVQNKQNNQMITSEVVSEPLGNESTSPEELSKCALNEPGELAEHDLYPLKQDTELEEQDKLTNELPSSKQSELSNDLEQSKLVCNTESRSLELDKTTEQAAVLKEVELPVNEPEMDVESIIPEQNETGNFDIKKNCVNYGEHSPLAEEHDLNGKSNIHEKSIEFGISKQCSDVEESPPAYDSQFPEENDSFDGDLSPIFGPSCFSVKEVSEVEQNQPTNDKYVSDECDETQDVVTEGQLIMKQIGSSSKPGQFVEKNIDLEYNQPPANAHKVESTFKNLKVTPVLDDDKSSGKELQRLPLPEEVEEQVECSPIFERKMSTTKYLLMQHNEPRGNVVEPSSTNEKQLCIPMPNTPHLHSSDSGEHDTVEVELPSCEEEGNELIVQETVSAFDFGHDTSEVDGVPVLKELDDTSSTCLNNDKPNIKTDQPLILMQNKSLISLETDAAPSDKGINESKIKKLKICGDNQAAVSKSIHKEEKETSEETHLVEENCDVPVSIHVRECGIHTDMSHPECGEDTSNPDQTTVCEPIIGDAYSHRNGDYSFKRNDTNISKQLEKPMPSPKITESDSNISQVATNVKENTVEKCISCVDLENQNNVGNPVVMSCPFTVLEGGKLPFVGGESLCDDPEKTLGKEVSHLEVHNWIMSATLDNASGEVEQEIYSHGDNDIDVFQNAEEGQFDDAESDESNSKSPVSKEQMTSLTRSGRKIMEAEYIASPLLTGGFEKPQITRATHSPELRLRDVSNRQGDFHVCPGLGELGSDQDSSRAVQESDDFKEDKQFNKSSKGGKRKFETLDECVDEKSASPASQSPRKRSCLHIKHATSVNMLAVPMKDPDYPASAVLVASESCSEFNKTQNSIGELPDPRENLIEKKSELATDEVKDSCENGLLVGSKASYVEELPKQIAREQIKNDNNCSETSTKNENMLAETKDLIETNVQSEENKAVACWTSCEIEGQSKCGSAILDIDHGKAIFTPADDDDANLDLYLEPSQLDCTQEVGHTVRCEQMGDSLLSQDPDTDSLRDQTQSCDHLSDFPNAVDADQEVVASPKVLASGNKLKYTGEPPVNKMDDQLPVEAGVCNIDETENNENCASKVDAIGVIPVKDHDRDECDHDPTETPVFEYDIPGSDKLEDTGEPPVNRMEDQLPVGTGVCTIDEIENNKTCESKVDAIGVIPVKDHNGDEFDHDPKETPEFEYDIPGSDSDGEADPRGLDGSDTEGSGLQMGRIDEDFPLSGVAALSDSEDTSTPVCSGRSKCSVASSISDVFADDKLAALPVEDTEGPNVEVESESPMPSPEIPFCGPMEHKASLGPGSSLPIISNLGDKGSSQTDDQQQPGTSADLNVSEVACSFDDDNEEFSAPPLNLDCLNCQHTSGDDNSTSGDDNLELPKRAQSTNSARTCIAVAKVLGSSEDLQTSHISMSSEDNQELSISMNVDNLKQRELQAETIWKKPVSRKRNITETSHNTSDNNSDVDMEYPDQTRDCDVKKKKQAGVFYCNDDSDSDADLPAALPLSKALPDLEYPEESDSKLAKPACFTTDINKSRSLADKHLATLPIVKREVEELPSHSGGNSRVYAVLERLRAKHGKLRASKKEAQPGANQGVKVETRTEKKTIRGTSNVTADNAADYMKRVQQVLDKLDVTLECRPKLNCLPRVGAWQKEVKNLNKRTTLPKTVIAVVGDTGSGKSSLMNALLDHADILPTSGMRACTAVVVEICNNEDSDFYSADIEFLKRDEWYDELKLLLSELKGKDGKVRARQPAPDSEASVAWSKIRAVYGVFSDGVTFNQLACCQTVTRWLEKTKRITAHSAKEFRRQVDKYIESTDMGTGGQFWPIVRHVRLRIPNCDVCSSGATLVDLPGIRDSNAARDQIAKEFLKNCTAVWVVASVHRAVDDKTAKELLGEHFRRQLLMDGQYGSVSFICTKTDILIPSELMRALNVREECGSDERAVASLEDDLLPMRDSLHMLEQEMKNMERRLEELEEEKNEAVNDIDDLALALSQSDEMDNFEVQEQEDTLHNLVEEKTSEIVETNMHIKNIRREKKEKNKAILEVENLISEHRRAIAAICARARNEYSKGQIKRDFKAGLKELKRCAGMLPEQEEDDYSDEEDEADEDLNYTVENLKVFCVSSVEYLKMKRLLPKDGPPQVFRNTEETGIPSLKNFVHSMTQVRRMQGTERVIKTVGQFVSDIQTYLSDEGTKSGAIRDSARSLFEQSLNHLKDQLLPEIVEGVNKSMDKCFEDNLKPKVVEGTNAAAGEASSTADKWGSPVNRTNEKEGGLCWPTYKAVCRRNGMFKSPSSGRPIDFNEDLVSPFLVSISFSWEKIFNSLLWRIMDGFLEAVLRALKTFGTKLREQLIVLGMRKDRLDRVIKQHLASAGNKLSDTVTLLKDFITEKQRELNRIMTPIVQNHMIPVYSQCTNESGSGSFARMKGHMSKHVLYNKNIMFDQASKHLLQQLVILQKEILSRLEDTLKDLLAEMTALYEPLWEEPTNTRLLKETFLLRVQVCHNLMQRLQSDANIALVKPSQSTTEVVTGSQRTRPAPSTSQSVPKVEVVYQRDSATDGIPIKQENNPTHTCISVAAISGTQNVTRSHQTKNTSANCLACNVPKIEVDMSPPVRLRSGKLPTALVNISNLHPVKKEPGSPAKRKRSEIDVVDLTISSEDEEDYKCKYRRK